MGKNLVMDCSNIYFCFDKSKIKLDELQELFKLGAFWAKTRTQADLKIAIDHSDPVVCVWSETRLIGFARATSDCIYRATIWDVVVHPEYQGAGIGRKLVETVLAHPKVNRVERVYLMTTHKQNFYKRIGFLENETTTMILYNNAPVPNFVATEPEESNTVIV